MRQAAEATRHAAELMRHAAELMRQAAEATRRAQEEAAEQAQAEAGGLPGKCTFVEMSHMPANCVRFLERASRRANRDEARRSSGSEGKPVGVGSFCVPRVSILLG